MPPRRFSALIVGCALASTTFAADKPTIVITGPTKAQAGDLVILDASQTVAADFAWLLVDSSKTFLAVDGGRRCVFASGTPGRYTFVLSAAAGDRVAVATHSLVVDGAPPPPGPDPAPPSPPDFPPGRFGLARQALDWAQSLSPAAEHSRSAASLAKSFRATAAAIAAGTLTLPKDILAQTKASNNDALGAAADAWKPWGNQLADRLQSLHDAGQLRTPDDYQTAWNEIAAGLEIFAKLPSQEN